MSKRFSKKKKKKQTLSFKTRNPHQTILSFQALETEVLFSQAPWHSQFNLSSWIDVLQNHSRTANLNRHPVHANKCFGAVHISLPTPQLSQAQWLKQAMKPKLLMFHTAIFSLSVFDFCQLTLSFCSHYGDEPCCSLSHRYSSFSQTSQGYALLCTSSQAGKKAARSHDLLSNVYINGRKCSTKWSLIKMHFIIIHCSSAHSCIFPSTQDPSLSLEPKYQVLNV